MLVSVIFWLHSGSRLVLLFIVLPEETDSERLKDLPLDTKVVSGGGQDSSQGQLSSRFQI